MISLLETSSTKAILLLGDISFFPRNATHWCGPFEGRATIGHRRYNNTTFPREATYPPVVIFWRPDVFSHLALGGFKKYYMYKPNPQSNNMVQQAVSAGTSISPGVLSQPRV